MSMVDGSVSGLNRFGMKTKSEGCVIGNSILRSQSSDVDFEGFAFVLIYR